MLPETIAFLPLLHKVSSSFTSAFLCSLFLPPCLPYTPSPSLFLQKSVPALLTQGTVPTPNTAELKQTHWIKTSHVPLSLLPLSLLPLFLLVLFLSWCLLFSHSKNKLFRLYLFYKGRPDHHRESFKLFQALPAEFPWKNAVVRSINLLFCSIKIHRR